MFLITFLIIGCLSVSRASLFQTFPEVKTSLGNIRGTYGLSYGNNTYMSFRGIPYAEPPVEDLRFRDPVEYLREWDGTFLANEYKTCVQVDHVPSTPAGVTKGEEDCLYLNVFVPGNIIDPLKKLDVVVNIHGGGFMYGFAQMGQEHFVMDRDLLLVTFNYRVGIMGFLSSADKYLPGNFGMKDQVMALRWVQRHIESFGGNKDSVMLAGLSAGAASVHFHYLSPLSKGLFHSGISYSACALNPWTFQEEPLNKTRIVANAVGCNFGQMEDVVNCLRTIPATELSDAVRLLRPYLFNPFAPLSLVVDVSSPNPFLPEHPYKLLQDGKVHDVPWILSATTSEGLYPSAEFLINDYYLNEIDENWREYSSLILHYEESIPDSEKAEVADKLKEYYLADESISNDTFYSFTQMISDRLYIVDEEIAARMQANATSSEVYFCHFDYVGKEIPSAVEEFTGLKHRIGVSHGDDFEFILTSDNTAGIKWLPDVDERMKDDLIEVWTSLLRTGKPKPDYWEPVRKHVSNPFRYIYIGRDGQFEMKQTRELGHRGFWESIDFKENAKLFYV